MSESLIVKDGYGHVKSLQVDSGSNGYISNHTIVSTVSGTQLHVYTYHTGSSTIAFSEWNFHTSSNSGSFKILDYTQRKGIIISNNSENTPCYLYIGGLNIEYPHDDAPIDLFEIEDITKPPPRYMFCLEGGGVYFGDAMTSNLEHYAYIPSSSILAVPGAVSINVTEIY